MKVWSLTVGPENARAEKYTQQDASEIPSREIPFIQTVLSSPHADGATAKQRRTMKIEVTQNCMEEAYEIITARARLRACVRA